MAARRKTFTAWSAVAGIVSAAAFLAAAELIALLVAPQASPLLAVGSFVIDIVPQPLKEFAISTFGANDKIALLVGLGLAVVIASAIAGILEYVRPPLGAVLLVVAGVLSGAAILTRAGAGVLSALPPLVGTIVGVVLILMLGRRLRAWRDRAAAAPTESDPEEGAETAGASRRGFLGMTAIAAAASVVVGVGSRVISATTSSIAAVRDAIQLPAVRSTVTVPAGAEADVEGLSPLFTPNAEFYRVDTALTVPSIDPSTWRLVIDGMVDQRIELSFDDLVGMGLDEYGITLTCVSNEVGGGLVGNAIWQGVPIRDILAMAGPQAGADMVLSRSVDGYTASTPLDTLTDDNRDAIFAVAMNGEPLPLEHGFPVRMVVPGLYGYVSATKWVTELKVTTFAADEAYWTPRGYAAEAPIKMSSRIDTPRSGTPVNAGTVPIAGMAWAQTTGIQSVEVSIDDGDWQQANLSTPVNADTWVQWWMEWQAEAGTHYVTVRATDKNGQVQIEDRAPIAPDGSSGWQRTLVTVR
ncbi:oxidoreductase [Microbacterium sp. Gd 4-13]|uniref:molybdopterin-dependent oxidoreductase n=1 Tax=Microbacterium sp. Gd 4-13 TaxID=2173179 RepID=UPI000D576C52|nr:molybdopterin-dependent oxidoreductase [Microbacterium sp. Gd 4-13]PVW04631.1 oxidoreductase [Microbacterium sp. Gd 4-13]